MVHDSYGFETIFMTVRGVALKKSLERYVSLVVLIISARDSKLVF